MILTTKNIINDKDKRIREKSISIEYPYSIEDQDFVLSLHEYVKNSQDEILKEKYNLKGAVGIAAVQVGVLKRAFAVVVEDDNGKRNEYALINPKVVSHSTKLCYLESGEGCLSVDEPHIGYVPRYFRIKLVGFDCITQKEVEINAKGYFAVVLQHELDHLDGILFYDRINKKEPLKPIENAIIL